MKFINLFSSFVVRFCPPGSGYRSRDLSNPDSNTDPQHWLADYKLRDLTFKCVKDSSKKVNITVFVNLLFCILLSVFKLRIADPDPDFADWIHNFFLPQCEFGLRLFRHTECYSCGSGPLHQYCDF
jgi:hypothetical protein